MAGIGKYPGECHPHHISVFVDGKWLYVPYPSILYLQSTKGHTTFVRRKEKELVAKHHLGHFQAQMPCCLVRVHQSYIINLHYLESETPEGRLFLRTEKEHEIWLGKTFEKSFYPALEAWNNRHLLLPPPVLPADGLILPSDHGPSPAP